MKYVVAERIFRFLKECIFVPLADKQAEAKKDLLTDHLVVCNKLMSIYIFHAWYICLYSTNIALIAQSNSFNHFLYRGSFYGQWEKCRFGTVQTFTIPRTTRYLSEKHFHTIMETIQEHIMVERGCLKKGSLDWIREQC